MKHYIIFILYSLFSATWRYKISDESELLNKIADRGKGAIFTFWHGKMLLGWDVVLKHFEKPFGVVSPSKDGQILAKVLEMRGYRILKGSSDKSPKALLENMVNVLNSNNILVMTPDGPRGPHQVVKAGAVVAAVRSQSSLVSMEISASKYWKLKSWDNFEIPKPFSKVSVSIERVDTFGINISNRDRVDKAISELERKLGT